MLLYKKGTQLVDKNGVPQWEKHGDEEWDWWICLNSFYIVERKEIVQEWKPAMSKYVDVEIIHYDRHPESEKYLYKKDDKGNDLKNEFNRWSFKWTDEQVKKYYEGIYTIK